MKVGKWSVVLPALGATLPLGIVALVGMMDAHGMVGALFQSLLVLQMALTAPGIVVALKGPTTVLFVSLFWAGVGFFAGQVIERRG